MLYSASREPLFLHSNTDTIGGYYDEVSLQVIFVIYYHHMFREISYWSVLFEWSRPPLRISFTELSLHDLWNIIQLSILCVVLLAIEKKFYDTTTIPSA
jgi:hypothetical protein